VLITNTSNIHNGSGCDSPVGETEENTVTATMLIFWVVTPHTVVRNKGVRTNMQPPNSSLKMEAVCTPETLVKKSKTVPLHAMQALGYSSYSFSTSALYGGEWSASCPGRALTPEERTLGTHWTEGWVGPRAGLDTEVRGKILCPCRGSKLDRPVVQPVVRHYTD
jgi:hypothetical protein